MKRAPVPNETVGPHIERTEGPLVNRIGQTVKDNSTTAEVHSGHMTATNPVRGSTARTVKGTQAMQL